MHHTLRTGETVSEPHVESDHEQPDATDEDDGLARRYRVGLLLVPALVYLGFSVIYYLAVIVPLVSSPVPHPL